MQLAAWSQLASILVPLGGRELVHWRARARSAKPAPGTSHGGLVSAAVWNGIYLALLAFAVAAIVGREAWHAGAVGIPLVWAGAVLRGFAYHALGEHYAVTIFVRGDHALVRSGPYRCLRHPLHLGLHVEMLGLALVQPQMATLGLWAVSVGVLVLRNRVEERALVHGLGDAYREYRERAWDLIDLLPARWRQS
jgi:protein-S-isoprenylcysteine O-methyltransferase Ste14